MRRLVACVALTAALICSAQANVINLGPIDLTGQGLGATDPLLTLHATGGATTEAGTLSASSGPTFSQLHWSSAADVRLLFNPTEPQTATDKSITIDTITLSFRSSGGATLNLTSGPIVFPETDAGVGNSGFLLGLDSGQLLTLATFLAGAGNIGDVRLGITAFLSGVAGGPETFSAISSVPLPPALVLFLSGLVGLGFLGRRKMLRRM